MPARPLWTLLALALAAGAAHPVHAETLTRTSAFEYDALTGQLIKEVVEPGNSDLCLVTEYTYDNYGNKVSASTRNCNSLPISGTTAEAAIPAINAPARFDGRSSSSTYDARGQFPLTSTNALGQIESRTYDTRFGVVLTLTGPNGLTTRWEYDTFGRKTREIRADSTESTWAYQRCADVGGCPSLAQYRVVTTTTGAPDVIAYFDALKREIRSEGTGFSGTLVRKDTEFDARGRVARSSSPYYVGQSINWAVPTYDDLNRVLTQTTPDGTITSFSYAGLTSSVTISPQAGITQTKTTLKNSQGQVTRVLDAQNKVLDYEYDAHGNLLKTTDALGNQSLLSYDLRGRKTQMTDPDMGQWSYIYNALGELVRQTDAKAQLTTLVYDKLGRMTARNEPGLNSTWTYDTCTMGVGKLCQVGTDNGYSRSHAYDGLGRPTVTTVNTDAVAQTLTTSYDSVGRLAQLTYPTGFAITYGYNTHGYLDKLTKVGGTSPLWQATERSATGRTLVELLGNGLTTHRTYDVVDRLTAIQSGNGTTTVHQHGYTYDQLGNLTQRIDQTQNITENFAYDSLNRLTMVSGSVATRSYSYDAIGNMTYKSDVGNYSYPASGAGAARPHAVTQVAGLVNASYSYDANGNLFAGNGRTLTYTSFNAPVSIASASHSFTYTYNAEHERVRLITVRPDDTLTSLYFHPDGKGKLFYEREHKQSDGSLEHKHYIQAGGELVGVYVTRSTGLAEMRYYHHDHLGSVAAITNEAGARIEQLAYEAFGERRYPNGTPQDRNSPLVGLTTDRGFTSHEHLDELNLIHMNGRVYDPALGRFMTADPYLQSPDNLQSYNRYAYVLNNPLMYSDPSGYFRFLDVVRIAAVIAVAYITGYGVQGAMISTAQNAAASTAFATAVATDFTGAVGVSLTATGGAIAGAAGGFVGGLAASDGDFSSALRSAIGAAAFGAAGTVPGAHSPERYLAHAAAGCLQGGMGGGGCARGVAAAVAGKWATNYTEGNPVATIVAGGTVSVIGGGKFGNGATTAAFGYLFNQMAGRAAAAARGCLLCLGGRSALGDSTGNSVLDDALGFGSRARALILNVNEAGDSVPDLPTGLTGENPRQGSGNRINTDLPGNSQGVFDSLSGGKSTPQGDGTLVAPNGARLRPGKEGQGPRIDIPANGSRPHETIHFPPGS